MDTEQVDIGEGKEAAAPAPPGSGARLGFLLGVNPSRSTSGAGPRAGLPPFAAGTGAGTTRKRGRLPSSDVGG
jgi:hypothetical protein